MSNESIFGSFFKNAVESVQQKAKVIGDAVKEQATSTESQEADAGPGIDTQTMAMAIQEALSANGIQGVEAHVDDAGVCTLAGQVGSGDDAAIAAEMAYSVGVADVVNQIEVMEIEAPEEDDEPAAEIQTYTVQKGDSYWKIAEQFYGDGAKHAFLKAANEHIGGLHPGKKLVVPALPEAGDGELHVVRKGDSYWKIAAKHYGHGKYFPYLQEANADLGGLHPGKVVVIPPRASVVG